MPVPRGTARQAAKTENQRAKGKNQKAKISALGRGPVAAGAEAPAAGGCGAGAGGGRGKPGVAGPADAGALERAGRHRPAWVGNQAKPDQGVGLRARAPAPQEPTRTPGEDAVQVPLETFQLGETAVEEAGEDGSVGGLGFGKFSAGALAVLLPGQDGLFDLEGIFGGDGDELVCRASFRGPGIAGRWVRPAERCPAGRRSSRKPPGPRRFFEAVLLKTKGFFRSGRLGPSGFLEWPPVGGAAGDPLNYYDCTGEPRRGATREAKSIVSG